MTYRYRAPSTHAYSALPDGSYGMRTLCQSFMSVGPNAAPVSSDFNEVTCKACLKRGMK